MKILRDTEKITDAEAAVLDCDGTIIDASNSYDLAIRIAIAIIIDKLFNIEIELGEDFEDALCALRMTGGFNNDCDSTSVLLQTICIFLPSILDIKLTKWDKVENADKYAKPVAAAQSSPRFIHEALKWLSYEIKSRKEYLDLRKIEKLLDVKAVNLGVSDKLFKLRSILNYPGPFKESFLTTLFDEIFLGAEGVREKYSWEPRYIDYSGTLKNEKLLIREESVKRLNELLPKGVALVTGRGRWETEKTLQPILKYFKMEASIFTADKGSEYEKPSPKSLIETANILRTKKIIYVGNSMEDLLMSQAASRKGLEIGFIAVSDNEELSREFEALGANAILEDINELPILIEATRS
jgi:phosphoglycolate phosphatase-like HAD superfamily hydrolase